MRLHRCNKCNFAFSKDLITVSGELRKRAKLNWFDLFCFNLGFHSLFERKIVDMGYFSLADWTDHSNFYLFQCPDCKHFSVDYIHGYTSDGFRSGLYFLICEHCDFRLIVYGKKFYENRKPESLFSILFNLIKFKFAR